eukprot:GFKZ01003218.1.p1 GENE.GFKZ01003218.1~~GFKZ01003218.1.p1  ORF type:complete len:131 (+),score=14.89 GFKZ01003218.1:485-877(+)
MTNSPEEQLLRLSQELLDSIDQQNWDKYSSLVDLKLTSFEPEGRGHLIEGLRFHQFYFFLAMKDHQRQSTISSPKIRIMGDTAIVTYVRLVQEAEDVGPAPTLATEETRVWQKQDGNWRNVHFHRSHPST